MRLRLSLSALLAMFLAAWLAAAPSASPVADAAMHEITTRFARCCSQGADVSAAQGDGMTALHWAAEHGDAALADVLLYAGANVSAGHAHWRIHAAAPREPHRQRDGGPRAAESGCERRRPHLHDRRDAAAPRR